MRIRMQTFVKNESRQKSMTVRESFCFRHREYAAAGRGVFLDSGF